MPRLRPVVLAATVMIGALRLSTADAAPPVDAGCNGDWLYDYGYRYCASQGARFASLTYACNADNTVQILEVSCTGLLPNVPG